MQLHKIFIPNRGFSLIELLVVMGLLAILGSFSLMVSMENYRGSSFAESQATLVSALQKARSQALFGVCIGSGCTAGQPHGVHIDSNQLVLFQGTTYNADDPNNEYLPVQSAGITFSGIHDVVFTEFSGDATPAGAIVSSDTVGHISTTTIGSDGQIMLSN
jgi:prepilin-type N-terminal cleavage/methylation domain-containing protein